MRGRREKRWPLSFLWFVWNLWSYTEGSTKHEDIALKKKVFFAIFLAFFVLFGGGRSGDWVIVCRDVEGWTYQVELKSIEIASDDRLKCLVRTEKDGHAQQALWTLDTRRNTLRVGDGSAEVIRPGSVADRVRRLVEARQNPGRSAGNRAR